MAQLASRPRVSLLMPSRDEPALDLVVERLAANSSYPDVEVVVDSGVVGVFGIDLVGPGGFHVRGTRVLEPAGRRRLKSRPTL